MPTGFAREHPRDIGRERAFIGHVNQGTGANTSIGPCAQISDSPRDSGATPSGCTHSHPHEPDRDKTVPSHVNLDTRPGTRSDRHGTQQLGKAKPQHGSPSRVGARGLQSGVNITDPPKVCFLES
jgi:hypothetical protein